MNYLEQLKTCKGLILDADGVWFTGEEHRFVLPSGEVVVGKTRDFKDGQGLSFLRALGLKVVFATGESQPLDSIVEKINNLPSLAKGEWAPVSLFTGELKAGGKVGSLEKWMQKENLTWQECAYIGDDRSDLEAMRLAGLKVAPADASRLAKNIADIVLTKNGGKGAIREFAEAVLDARGVSETDLPTA